MTPSPLTPAAVAELIAEAHAIANNEFNAHKIICCLIDALQASERRAKEAERLLAESDAALLWCVHAWDTGRDFGNLYVHEKAHHAAIEAARIRTAAQREAKDG